MNSNRNDLQRFEQMPEGWRRDRTWGSPEFGWEPICNGKSILNGGRKGLLRVDLTALHKERLAAQSKRVSKKPSLPKEEAPTKLSEGDIQAIAKTRNDLARAKFKEKLMQDLLFDLTVCRLEGWDAKEYVTELKQLIDDAYQSVVG